MAVSSTVVLPNQPTAGNVSVNALAGNGYTAPHSETRARITLDGAVGGGTAEITVFWDPRWVSLVSWATFGIAGLAAPAFAEMNYRVSAFSSLGATLSIPTGLTGVDSVATWSPPPQFASVPSIGATQPNFRAVTANIDGDDYQLDLVLYNFKKDVLQVTPLPILLACLPRAGSVT